MVLWFGLLATGLDASAADWTGYASIASDRIYRGVSLLDNGPAFQGGVEGLFDDRYVLGASAANVDHQWLYQYRAPDHVQLDVYGGADFSCGSRCRVRALLTAYVFPGPQAHDWQEASISVAFAERVGATVSWAPDGYGSGSSTRAVEGWFAQPLTRLTSAEIDAGKVWLGNNGYWFTRAGLSHRVDRWVFALSRYWSDPLYARYGFDDRTRRYVLSISTAF